MRPVDFFHIGAQKCATSWVFRCMEEHPQVACPPRDSIHYYDMHYHRGPSWYEAHFASAEPGQLRYDPTPSYLRSPLAPERIAKENPKAKIVLCIRNPIERAFSHYWHEKKKKRCDYTFDEVFVNYDLYASWIEPAWYSRHIQRYLADFPRDQVLVQRFDHLSEDSRAFLRELLEFLDIDTDFQPTVLDKKVNQAVPERTEGQKRVRTAVRTVVSGLGVTEFARSAKPLFKRIGVRDAPQGRMENLADVDPEVRRQLHALFEPEIARLECMLQLDLSGWRLNRV
jgi:hypothetical protein